MGCARAMGRMMTAAADDAVDRTLADLLSAGAVVVVAILLTAYLAGRLGA